MFRSVELNYIFIFMSGVVASLLTLKALGCNGEIEGRVKTTSLQILKVLIIMYGLFLFFTTIVRYYNFSSEVIDVSYYHSVVWQLADFKIPRIWDIPSRFVWGDHFEPTLFFIVPLYWFGKDAVILMIIQAGLVISGAIPIYLTVVNKLKSQLLALSLSAAYLLFGGLQMGYAYGFHPILFFPTLFFWTYYFLERDNIKAYFFFLFLSLFVKEEVSLIAFFLGLYLFLVKRKYAIGMGTLLLSLLWYLLCFNFIFPHFTGGQGFGHWGQYGELGKGGVLGLMRNAIFQPGLFFRTLVTPRDKVETFFHIFGAFSFLPFLYPPSLLFTIPSLLEKLLSSNIARLNGFHYSAAICGVIVVSSIESLSFILKKPPPQFKIISNPNFLGLAVLYISIFSNILYGYKPLSPLSIGREKHLQTEHKNLLYKVINSIPQEASVSAQYQIAPHINRSFGKIHSAPTENEDADYVILDTKLPLVLTSADYYIKYLKNLLSDKSYKLIVNEDEILVFKKIEK